MAGFQWKPYDDKEFAECGIPNHIKRQAMAIFLGVVKRQKPEEWNNAEGFFNSAFEASLKECVSDSNFGKLAHALHHCMTNTLVQYRWVQSRERFTEELSELINSQKG
jgi:hypothetical protein